jgi:membrane-bound metal-dependent hydrolase YbcI (DUF457 family)
VIAWHSGGAIFLFRWIFRDPKADVRFLILGALLPDLIDLTIGLLVFGASHALGHTLVIPALFMGLVLITTRRGKRRRAWMVMTVGWLFHLLLDGMWTDREVFFWPFFGLEFPPAPQPFWGGLWSRAMGDPWRWIKEAAGLGYLMILWRRYRLNPAGIR